MEDIELRQIFVRLFEKIESVETVLNGKFNSLDRKFNSMDEKFTSLDEKFTSLDGKFNSLDEKFNSLDEKFNSLDEKFNSLDSKVMKNSIQIESIQSDIKTIVEVQKAHMEQNERDHKNIMEHIDNRTGFLENILIRHSEEINILKRKIG